MLVNVELNDKWKHFMVSKVKQIKISNGTR